MSFGNRLLLPIGLSAGVLLASLSPSIADDSKKFGVLIYNIGVDPWINVAVKTIEDTAAAKGYDVAVADGRNDVAQMNSIIDQFVIQGVDAIIIHPADRDSLVGSVSRATAAGVPVVSFSHGLSEEANLTSFVGADEVKMGRAQAEYVVDTLGGKGKVGIMLGILGTSGQLGRSQGEHEIFDAADGITIVEEQASDWQHEKAVGLMQNWLSKYPTGELQAVISQGPELVAAAAYAKSQGRDDIIFVALDYPNDARQAILEGVLDATVNQDPKLMANLAFDAAESASKGEKVEKVILIDAPLVTKENVNEIPAAY